MSFNRSPVDLGVVYYCLCFELAVPLKSLDCELMTAGAFAGFGLSILGSGELQSSPDASLNFEGLSVLSERQSSIEIFIDAFCLFTLFSFSKSIPFCCFYLVCF